MRLRITSFACAAAISGCGHHGREPVDFGAPRTLIYVADEGPGTKHTGGTPSTVHVFDGATLAPIGRFAVGQGAGEVHATRDGRLVWVVSSRTGEVTFLDTQTYVITEVDVGATPVHSFLAPEGDTLWVGNDGSADVSIIDLSTLTVRATVLTGAGHHKLAFATTDTGALETAYVSNLTDGSITPVSPAGTTRANVAGLGPAPHGMDASAALGRVYNCSGDATNALEVIATRDDVGTVEDERDTIVARIPLPARCGYVRIDDVAGYAYATLGSADLFARVDLTDHSVETFATFDRPDRFHVEGSAAFVVHSHVAEVAVIDLAGVAPTESIPVGNAIAPGTTPTVAHRSVRAHEGRLYVPNAYDGTVTVIDLTSRTVVGTLAGMDAPVGVAIAGPTGGSPYPR